MSRFTGPLIIEEIKPGILWKLKAPLVFEVSQVGSDKEIIVPENFVTDGASITPFLKVFLAVWGTYGRAAALHDYLYVKLRNKDPDKYAVNRKQADAIFLSAMSACNTSLVTRYTLWIAVRLFGWHSLYFRKNKEEK